MTIMILVFVFVRHSSVWVIDYPICPTIICTYTLFSMSIVKKDKTRRLLPEGQHIIGSISTSAAKTKQ
jgi:thiamine transporter ThiT